MSCVYCYAKIKPGTRYHQDAWFNMPYPQQFADYVWVCEKRGKNVLQLRRPGAGILGDRDRDLTGRGYYGNGCLMIYRSRIDGIEILTPWQLFEPKLDLPEICKTFYNPLTHLEEWERERNRFIEASDHLAEQLEHR